MAQENQKCLKELESIHEELNRGNEETKREFLRKLVPLIKNWQGPLPNLRDIFRPEEIDWLLTESNKPHDDDIDPRPLVDFVINSGYKDEPKVGEDGKPLLRRTTPVHHAFRSEQYYIVPWLFKIYDRFDLNYTDEDGLTHFHVACKYGCDDVVKKFLEFGQVDPNLLVPETGDSPLLLAAKDGSREAMELLLRNGANPNLANEEGKTPLHFLCEWEELTEYDYDLITMLFELSNDKYQPLQINVQDKSGRTPLHYTCKDCENYYTKIAEWLLRNGADPNIADADGLTPLHIMCVNECDDRKESAEILFKFNGEKYQVQVDAQDKSGHTPLQLALRVYNEQVAEVLLRNGANPNLSDAEGSTPLHIISKNLYYDQDSIEKFFKINDEMQQTVQVDAQDKWGRTSLQWAVGNLKPNVVDVLLDRGANLSNFVFPHDEDFCKGYDTNRNADWDKLKLASGVLTVVEHLEKRGYELDRNDAIKIMKFFVNYELFEKSSDLEKCFHDDEEFAKKAKKQMINPSLSLHDVINLPPEKASKQLTYTDYYKFGRTNDLWRLSKSYIKEACFMHLCEKMSRGFFRRWSLDLILELTCYQLPILCCEIVIQKLKNEDLCNVYVCLATLQSS